MNKENLDLILGLNLRIIPRQLLDNEFYFNQLTYFLSQAENVQLHSLVKINSGLQVKNM